MYNISTDVAHRPSFITINETITIWGLSILAEGGFNVTLAQIMVPNKPYWSFLLKVKFGFSLILLYTKFCATS